MDMTINNVALSTMGATLLSVDYGYAKVTNYNDWLRNSKNPLFYGQDITYTTAEYSILVEGIDLPDLEKKCSNVAAAMSKAIVKVDGSNWSLDGHTTTTSNSNRISPLAREIEVSMEGVKVSDRDTQVNVITNTTPIEVEILGNSDVPCRLEIIPAMGAVTLEITINDTVYGISTIPSDSSSIVIDSEKGIVTLDGANKIEDYLNWELPYLKGGTNTIKMNTPGTLKISYNGRWM